MLQIPRAPLACVVALALMSALDSPQVAAQTDYYNLDDKRPLTVEDAVPIEWRAFELQLAPVRIERGVGRLYGYAFESELAYGILPRTQVEIGLPVAFADVSGGSRGLAGIEARVMHALWTETLGLPGVALTASSTLPVGPLGPDRTIGLVGAVLTRTTHVGRLHVDVRRGLGVSPDAVGAATDAVRWRAGAAVDHSFALTSTLVAAEVVAAQPVGAGRPVAWTASVGTRRQMAPRWVLDVGVGRRFAGDSKAWTTTLGTSYAFGMPGRSR
jgi:hypothetical protein